MYHVFLQVSTATTSGGMSVLGAVAGAIPVIGGIVSGLINNSAVDQANAENRQFSLDELNQQEAYNTAMWNAQNAYNSPEEVMQRYADAGLNPNLIYGGGAGTGNLAMAPAPAPRVDYVAMPHPAINGAAIASDAISAYNSVRTTSAQVDNLQQLSINTAQDTALKYAQTLDAQQDKDTKYAEELNLWSDTGLKDNQAAGQAIANLYSGDAMKASIARDQAQAQLALTQSQVDAMMAAPNLLIGFQQLANMQNQNNLTSAQIASVKAATENTQVQTKLANLDVYLQQHGLNKDSSFMSHIYATVLQGLAGGSWGQIQSATDQQHTNYIDPSGSGNVYVH